MPEDPCTPVPDPVPAAVLGGQGVFVWQRALHAAARDTLPEPIMNTLWVLALYMNPDGTQGRPGFERFEAARGKSDRTIRTHLDKAISAGWLRCVRRGGRAGDGTAWASVYAATFPAEVFTRLRELLLPAWGELPVTTAHPETHGLPDDSQPQPETHGLPDEHVSTGNPAASTGNLEVSIGSPALPTTDQSHQPLLPINQIDQIDGIERAAQEREAGAYLRGRYGAGLTAQVVAEVIAVAYARALRAGRPVRNLVAYLSSWQEGDLAAVVGAAMDAEDRAASQPEPPSAGLPPAYTTPAAEAAAAAIPPQQDRPPRPHLVVAPEPEPEESPAAAAARAAARAAAERARMAGPNTAARTKTDRTEPPQAHTA